jgi:hypothetical protein
MTAADSLIRTVIWVLLLSPIGALLFMWHRLSNAVTTRRRIHVAAWISTVSYFFLFFGLWRPNLLGLYYTSQRSLIILLNLVIVVLAGIAALFRAYQARGAVVGSCALVVLAGCTRWL